MERQGTSCLATTSSGAEGELGRVSALAGGGSGGGSREAPGGLCNARRYLPRGLSKPIMK